MITSVNGLSATPEALQNTEIFVKDTFGLQDALWTGRAATGLYFALQTLKKENPSKTEVIVPGLSCGTMANVTSMCGLVPRFADTDPNTGLISLDSIKKVHSERTLAVIFIHLYGNTGDVTLISDWCKANGIVFFEDVVQALGAVLPTGANAGSIADFTLFGFNKTKILECGGGMLGIKDADMAARIATTVDTMPLAMADSRVLEQLSLSYRNFHHSMVTVLRLHPEKNISPFFLDIRGLYEPLYLKLGMESAKIALAFAGLRDHLKRRQARADIYRECLEGKGPWQLMDNGSQSGCCWRFSLLLNDPGEVYRVSEAVRKDGFHVSNLYWPVNVFFRPEDVCTGSDYMARRIINLWVDDNVDEAYVIACANSMIKNCKTNNTGN